MNIARKIPAHWYVVASAWFSKVVTIAAQLLAIRLIIGILGEEKYAVFALIMALLNWSILIDMGMGNSLQNAISARRARNESFNDLIASTLLLLTVTTLSLMLLLWYVLPFISDIYFAKFQSVLNEERNLLQIAAVLFSGIALGLVITKVWYAEQAGWKANLLTAIGWTLGLPSIYLFNIIWRYNSLESVLIAFYLPQSLIGWGCFLFFLVKSTWNGFVLRWDTYRRLIRKALGFWLLLLIYFIALQSDFFIISQHFRAQEIVQYSVIAKVFSITNFFFTAILSALWPICSEAAERKQWGLFFYYSKKYIKIGILFIIICTIGFALSRDIVSQVLAPKENLTLPLLMIVLFGACQILRIWCDTFIMLLQSLGCLKPSLLLYSLQAILGITLQWYGSMYFGYAGLIIGLALSMLFTTVWGLPYVLSSYIRQRQ